jgi:putative ABC transport system permease protein
MSWFALKTLLTDRGKALTALLGVVFSLVLVDLQGGLYFGLIGKASLLTDRCAADLWIGHRQVENVDFAQTIPVQRINRLRGVPGVDAAEPYIVGKGIATLRDGGFEDVWVIGADPESMLGGPQAYSSGAPDELLRPDAISIDELDAAKLGHPSLGDVIEGSHDARRPGLHDDSLSVRHARHGAPPDRNAGRAMLLFSRPCGARGRPPAVAPAPG